MELEIEAANQRGEDALIMAWADSKRKNRICQVSRTAQDPIRLCVRFKPPYDKWARKADPLMLMYTVLERYGVEYGDIKVRPGDNNG